MKEELRETWGHGCSERAQKLVKGEMGARTSMPMNTELNEPENMRSQNQIGSVTCCGLYPSVQPMGIVPRVLDLYSQVVKTMMAMMTSLTASYLIHGSPHLSNSI